MNIKSDFIEKLKELIKEYNLQKGISLKEVAEKEVVIEKLKDISLELKSKIESILAKNNIFFDVRYYTLEELENMCILNKELFSLDIIRFKVTQCLFSIINNESDEYIKLIGNNDILCSMKTKTCRECGSVYYYGLDLKESKIVPFNGKHKCVEVPEIIKTKVRVNGKIGFSNVMRSFSPEIDVNAPSISSKLGKVLEIKQWAKHNISRCFVGHQDLHVWMKDDEIVVGNIYKDNDYEKEIKMMKDNGYSDMGYVIIDAWTIHIFNGKAKEDEASLIIDTPYKTVMVEHNLKTGSIKITGLK